MKPKGIYILELFLRKGKEISIGKLGTFFFKNGYYFYVGSAHQVGGIEGRVSHHLTHANKPHWHIDYFRKDAKLKEVHIVIGEKELEHQYASILNKFLCAPIPSFGSSDCKCSSHLFYSKNHIDIKQFFNNLSSIKTLNRKIRL